MELSGGTAGGGEAGEIVESIRANQVVVVVSDTGSGKTTQLPKMVAEALETKSEKVQGKAKTDWLHATTEDRGSECCEKSGGGVVSPVGRLRRISGSV